MSCGCTGRGGRAEGKEKQVWKGHPESATCLGSGPWTLCWSSPFPGQWCRTGVCLTAASSCHPSILGNMTFCHPQGKAGLTITIHYKSRPRKCAVFGLFLGKVVPFLCSSGMQISSLFFSQGCHWEEALLKSSQVRYLEDKMKPTVTSSLFLFLRLRVQS